MNSIRINSFVFKDTARFLTNSLKNLADVHYKSFKKFDKLLKSDLCQNAAGELSQEKYELLATGKQFFPHDFIKSQETLAMTSMPPKEAFYNKLTQKHITDSDYEHALKVWRVFECNTLFDYMMVYLRVDVLLLFEVFEQFRQTSAEEFSLYPEHFVSLPGNDVLQLLSSGSSTICFRTCI